MKSNYCLAKTATTVSTTVFLLVGALARVSAQTSEDVADNIESLRDQIVQKIDEDVDTTATAFADARELNRALFWSDLFSAPLQIFKDTLSSLMAVRDLNDLVSPTNLRAWILDGAVAADSAHEFLGVFSSADHLRQDGENLAMALDGPSYAARTEAIIEGAEEFVTFWSFDKELYKNTIRYDIYGIGDVETPLQVIRRSGSVDRRGGGVMPSIFEARRHILNKLNALSDHVRGLTLSPAEAQSLLGLVEDLRQSVLHSRTGIELFSYSAILEDDLGAAYHGVELSLGYTRGFEEWRVAMLNQFAANTDVEIRLRLVEDISYAAGLVAGEAIDTANLRLNVEAVIAGQVTANKIAEKAGSLALGVAVGEITEPLDISRSFASDAREQVSYIPQEMLQALPGEVTNLMLLTDDLVRTIGYETGAQTTVSGVSPPIVGCRPLPETVRITLTGEGFTASSRLTFNDGVNLPYTDRVPVSWSPTQIEYDIAVGIESATWTVQVTGSGPPSNTVSFSVAPPSGEAVLTGLAITGPSTIQSGGTAQFAAVAYYSDGSSNNVGASWAENSSSASISSGGQLSASSVSSNRPVTVSAGYTEGEVTKTASTVVMVVTEEDAGGSQTTDVIANGGFEAGESPWNPTGWADVVALSYPYSGSWYAYLGNANNAAGSLWQAFPVPENITEATLEFRINVSSDETSVSTEWDTMKVILATNNEQLLAVVDEFSNLDARSVGNYIRKSYDVTNELQGYEGEGLHLVFSGQTDESLPTIFRIDNVKLNVTTSTPVELVDLVIEGDSAVPENGFEAYVAYAVFSDGTTQRVSPSWSENSSIATISGAGYFQPGSVSSSTIVTVSASYSFNGNTESASKEVTVFPLSAPIVFVRLAIEGPGTVDEGGQLNLVSKAIYEDGSIQTVNPAWVLNSSWASINSNGRVDASEVTRDRTVEVEATYSIVGITRTATHELVILDDGQEPTLESLEILGDASIEEGGFGPYEARAHFDDGSSRYVVAAWSENSQSATISASGLLTASFVDSDQSVTVQANYSSGGINRTASKVVTVIDVPDTTGPTLAIESPADGISSPTNMVEVHGAASDGGNGNNGVTSVLVNGLPAAGGSVTAGGVANWSIEIDLAEGNNTINVAAFDGAGNVSTQTIVVLFAPDPPALPELRIRKVGDEFELSWPVGFDGWCLESSVDLGGTSPWVPVPGEPTVDQGLMRLLIGQDGPKRFFRLSSD